MLTADPLARLAEAVEDVIADADALLLALGGQYLVGAFRIRL